MATSVQCRLQERTLGMVMREVDEDLAMFLEMRRSEKEMNDQIPKHNCEESDPQLGSEVDFSLLSNGTSTEPANQDYLLNSENDKNDYDWLLSLPHTPSNPSLELEEQNIAPHQNATDSSSTAQDCKIETNSSTTAPESKISIEQDLAQPENSLEGPSSQSNSTGLLAVSRRKNSCAGNGRPLSSGGKMATSTRSATPTGRPRISASKPSRASTPTSRATLPSVKPVASTARSSTPTRAAPRSSTPTSRPSKPAASKSASRSATPTRRPSTPSSIPIVSISGARSSSLTKMGTTTSRKTAASRGTSPTMKSRPLKPLETPSLSRDSSINSKTLVPKRPASASRGRPSAPGARPSTTNSSSDGKPRRKSCSPSRGRATNATILSNAITLLSKSRGHGYEKDDVNPVLIGTQMVERVVNMRKLAPPKQDDNPYHENPSKKSLSRENSGFGRSFSKKSLDMALRHMDIRRSVNGTLRPVLTRVSSSSANSIRSSSTKNKTGSVSDSPLATSSTASSEPCINNSSNNVNWSEPEDDNFGCERELLSPTSQQHLEQYV
ncbi:putative GPI-anchored protein pfl2 isoform X1 [Nicotiana sylvestris]|uniref:Endochitinase A-like isoform X1 n=2 Tax=Nicotiana sylvestris TaxID=4096 RepID=A0A1U7YRH2_NICSY|nr:PREDICTED: endochitinase A-like isoform X1 [Nicotiana sylvestris]